MSRISDILVRARDTLADPNGSRWSDARLIRLVDEAQKDICRRAKLLRTKTILDVYSGQTTYQLPPDLLLLDKVLFNDTVLPLLSHAQLDEKDSAWEVKTGTVEACVYDKQSRGSIKLYPIPTVEAIEGYTTEGYAFNTVSWREDIMYEMNQDYGVIVSGTSSDTITSEYGVAVDINSYYCNANNVTEIPSTISSDYGLVTYIKALEKDMTASDNTYGITVSVDDYDMLNDYGVLTFIFDNNFRYETLNSDFGILTSWIVNNNLLTVYYLKKPNTITSVDDTLEIDDIFDSAIKYYVVGRALRDDMDTQNRQAGNEELVFYERELKEAIKDDYIDFTRNSNKQYIVSYKGGF